MVYFPDSYVWSEFQIVAVLLQDLSFPRRRESRDN